MSKFLEGLNRSQREAVTHETGPLLIIAGPGSGKTRTVAHSIAYAIEVLKVVPNRIAAFTFTRKAKDELKNRVSEIIENELANNIWISTFHSFCGSVVNTDLEPLRIEYDQEPTVKELLHLKSERIRAEIEYIQHHRFPEPDDVLPFITPCEESNINSSDAREYVPDPQMADIYVDTLKKYEQLADDDSPYTRVQLLTYLLFRDVPEVKKKWQEKFDLIFVDEYQDTDQVQYQIIKDLSERHQNLRVVGDDDQGIYGWRGADIQNILNYEQGYLKPTVISLGQNYRSTRQIVNASRAIIDFNPDRREKKLFTNNPEGDKVKHLHCEDREAEASTIAGFICRAIQSGWTANDFVVLCPSTKDQAAPFKEAFANSGIPFHVSESSLDMPTNGVSIMTIHKSKGLEFPNVFVAGVCSGLLPHHRSKEENWDEALRLLYVAMTRAENWLCLSSYEKDSSDKNTHFKRGPSRFLGFIPQSLVTRIKTLDNIAIPSRTKKIIVVEDTEESPKDATSLPMRHQTVLGIDPGKENVGWSITQRLPDRYTVCKYDTERPEGQPIDRKINELIMKYSPDAISVEKLEGATDEWFLHVAGCVAQIRSIADQRDIECHFYSPQDVKYAVTGNKKASKEEVQQAVRQVCNLKEIPEPHHSADAIATSLCYLRNYLNYSRFQNNARMREHYDLGSAYLGIRQYNEAIVEFEKTINNAPMIDPMYTKAHCGLTRAYLGLGKLDEAEHLANEALRLDSNYQPALKLLEQIKKEHYKRALTYLKIEQYDEAITEFNEALNRDPNFIDAYCGLGKAYLEKGNLREAENSAKKALKLNNNYQSALYVLESIKQRYCELARDYLEHGALVKAENLAKEVLRLDANYQPARELLEIIKQAYIDKGNDCLRRNKLEEAKKAAEEALMLNPNYQPALKLLEEIKSEYYNSGRNHLNNQQYDEAIAAFEETVDRYPKFTAAYCGLGQAYLGKGSLTAAEKSAKAALKLENNYQPALHVLESIKQKYCELARGYLNHSDLVKAENLAKEALRRDDNYQPAHELLDAIKQTYCDQGYTHLNNRQHDKAIAAFTETINRDSSLIEAHYGLGCAYLEHGKLVEAEDSVQKALRLDNNCARVYALLEKIIQAHCDLGSSYLKLYKLEEAENSAKQALRLEPSYQPAHELLGTIQKRYFTGGLISIERGSYASAIELLQKASNLNPNDKYVYTNLGRAYYWIDEYDKAASCYQKAADIDPNDKTIHSNLGNAYYWMGDYDEAIRHLQKARNLDMDCEKIAYYLGRTWLALDKLEEAKWATEKALNIVPDYQPVLEVLEEIEQAFAAREDKRKLMSIDTMILIPSDQFYMDKYPVTNEQYSKFIAANPQWSKNYIGRKYHDGNYLKHWNGNNYPSGESNHPVVYVSTYAAKAYAQWVKKRLPTETEWEKAARGSLIDKKYPWGNSIDSSKANYGSKVGCPTPIGSYPSNNYGLYDMAGNVWEWCFDESPNGSPIYVWRGGSWGTPAQMLRVSSRYNPIPTRTMGSVGFRCVRSVTS